MGEIIKRALTPGVGQNPLSKWLDSPELLNPVKNQSTQLGITQELGPFQKKYRVLEDAQTLAGVEVVTRFDVTVPENECWEIDQIWFFQDSGATIVVQARTILLPELQFQNVRAQRRCPTGVFHPLIGVMIPLPAVSGDSDAIPFNPIKLLPGENLEIQNTTNMAAGDVGRIQVLYRHVPLPLEVEIAPAGLWQSTTL